MSKPIEITDLQKYDWILCIARGGLVLGGVLSYILNKRQIELLVVKSYEEDHQQMEVTIYEKDLSHLKDKSVLVVDDLVDSGSTMEEVVKYVQKFKASKISTFVGFKKKGSIFEPDYYIEERPADQWIDFKHDNISIEDLVNYLEEGK